MRKPEGEGEAPATETEDSRLARLERLATLHEKGVLTDEELAAEKAARAQRRCPADLSIEEPASGIEPETS